jgi:hypothetical protein
MRETLESHSPTRWFQPHLLVFLPFLIPLVQVLGQNTETMLSIQLDAASPKFHLS